MQDHCVVLAERRGERRVIKVKGSREEIAEAVKGISETYPTDLILHLTPGEWFFVMNGVDVAVLIEEKEGDD